MGTRLQLVELLDDDNSTIRMGRLKRLTFAIALAVLIGVPGGWVIAMLLTPALWHLEPILHIELAGHSGPSDWILYLVWLILIPLLFGIFWRLLRHESATAAHRG